jgi:hypothetical protein
MANRKNPSRRIYLVNGTQCVCFKGKLYAPVGATGMAKDVPADAVSEFEGGVQVAQGGLTEQWALTTRGDLKARAKAAPPAAE